jgi:hypothetical protein
VPGRWVEGEKARARHTWVPADPRSASPCPTGTSPKAGGKSLRYSQEKHRDRDVPGLPAPARGPDYCRYWASPTLYPNNLRAARKSHGVRLYYVLISEHARQYFEATARGVGYPAVDDKDFGSLPVPLPPLPEQQRIAAYLRTSCAAIDAVASMAEQDDESPRPKGVLNRQMDTLLAYRKSLIHECVTGQRRVTEADLKARGTHG